jgi:hypothetical protein
MPKPVSSPDKHVVKTMNQVLKPDFACKKDVCPKDSYVKAVKGLAALSGSEKLEKSDYEALGLRINLAVIADLIESDPYFGQVILEGEKALEQDATQIITKTAIPSIPPTYYRRMVYMMQVALRHLVDPDLPTTGYYGEKTAKAVEKFQEMVGIEGGYEGTIAGPRTLSALIMRCRMDKEALISKLTKSQEELASKGAFFYYDSSSSHPPKHAIEARELIGDALKWLGLMDVDTPAASHQAFQVLKDMYGQRLENEKGMTKDEANAKKEQLSLIGKNVMQIVIDAVVEA